MPGRRGLATRQRLISCTVTMLATTSYRDLKVIDITREAGTSPATFYQYFPDIETVVLSVAEQTADEGTRLRAYIENKQWRGARGYEQAREFVAGFLEFWRTHQPVLRVVDLLTEEGDARFRRARVRMLNAVTRALAAAIEAARTGSSDQSDPTAMAGALVSMIAHVAAHEPGFEAWNIHISDVSDAMARLVYWGVTGPRVAGG
jgi:AcrR family transcriptional regulator